MKVALSEIKKNLQENNSGVNEAENQINYLEHKKKSFTQKSKTKDEFKKSRIG